VIVLISRIVFVAMFFMGLILGFVLATLFYLGFIPGFSNVEQESSTESVVNNNPTVARFTVHSCFASFDAQHHSWIVVLRVLNNGSKPVIISWIGVAGGKYGDEVDISSNVSLAYGSFFPSSIDEINSWPKLDREKGFILQPKQEITIAITLTEYAGFKHGVSIGIYVHSKSGETHTCSAILP